MTITIKKSVVAIVVALLLLAPASTYASTYSNGYQPQTVAEKIAYLYGMIAQLQIQLNYLSDNLDPTIGVAIPRSRSDEIEISTLSARDIQVDEAELRGRIEFEDNNDWAKVWIEYGEDDDDLDERTSKRRLYEYRDSEQTFSFDVDDLRSDEKYYFRAVGESSEGDIEYGSIRSFTTDDDDRQRYDNELEVDDTSISVGDDIRVDWEVDSDDEGSRNWIGLYEVGDDNRDYIKWLYIANDSDGTAWFTIDTEGEFEFRLFLSNSYDDVAESDRIVVD